MATPVSDSVLNILLREQKEVQYSANDDPKFRKNILDFLSVIIASKLNVDSGGGGGGTPGGIDGSVQLKSGSSFAGDGNLMLTKSGNDFLLAAAALSDAYNLIIQGGGLAGLFELNSKGSFQLKVNSNILALSVDNAGSLSLNDRAIHDVSDPSSDTDADTQGARNQAIQDAVTDVLAQVATAISNAVAGLLDLRGSFDASSGAWPSAGGSGPADAILKADAWYVSVGGTLPTGVVVEAGDFIFANVDSPGNMGANWSKLNVNVILASSTAAGISKLYNNVSGSNTDGAPDQASVNSALALKASVVYVDGLLTVVSSTGTSIKFDVPRQYGETTPLTGDFTLDLTDFRKGVVQVAVHNAPSEPNYGPGFLKGVGFTYEPDVDNYIMFLPFATDRVLVTYNRFI